MPWASASTVPFEGIDPHLESLIRAAGQRQPMASEVNAFEMPVPAAPAAPAPAPEPVADPEAEAKLWQDLERVMDITDTPEIENILTVEKAAVVVTKTQIPENVESAEEDMPEPAEQNEESGVSARAERVSDFEDPAEKTAEEAAEEASEEAPEAISKQDAVESLTGAAGDSQAETPKDTPVAATAPLPSVVIEPYTPPQSGPLPAAAVAFTEPSPWGSEPLAQPSRAAEQRVSQSADPGEHPPIATSHEDDYLPAVDGEPSAVSPVVNRLRAQKKVRSLSSVQLPTFETAKAGSFKR